MNNVLSRFCILLMIFLSLPLSASVIFSGRAGVDMAFRYSSYQSRQADGEKKYYEFGIPSDDPDTALELSALLTEKKLSSEVTVRLDSIETGVESAWVSYDFGLISAKYSAIGLCSRWNDDMLFFDKADGSAFDISIADLAFFTIIGLKSETGGGLQDIDSRIYPVMSTGLDVKFSLFSMAIGGVLDINPASKYEKAYTVDTDGDGLYDAEQLQAESYTGYMGFVNAGFDMNPISLEAAFSYGKSIGNVTESEELTGKDPVALGVLATVAFTMGQTEFGNSFYWTHVQKAGNNEGRDVTGFTPVDAYIQYKFDNNFYIKPYVSYNRYSMDRNKEGSYNEIIGAVRAGFVW